VFKHFYTPEEIRESFLAHGITTKITYTPSHFFYVQGEKIPGPEINSKNDQSRRLT